MLLVTALLLEEFSYFIPEVYIKIVHHLIFKETEKNLKDASEQGEAGTGSNSKYELLLSLLDSLSEQRDSKNSHLYASIDDTSDSEKQGIAETT